MEQVSSALVADTEAAKALEPGERPLHHPPVPSESLGGVNPPPGDPRCDAPIAEGAAQGRGVVGFVGVQLGWPLSRPAWPSSWANDGRDGVDERKELRRIVGVRSRQPDGKGNPVAVDNKKVFGAGLAAIDRVRSRLFAPLLARTLRLSTLARDQSMAASSPSQLSSVS